MTDQPSSVPPRRRDKFSSILNIFKTSRASRSSSPQPVLHPQASPATSPSPSSLPSGVSYPSPGLDVVSSHGIDHAVVYTESTGVLELPSLIVAKPENPASMSDKLDRSRHLGWVACKDALKLVGEASDAFGPLKSALGGLLGILDRIEVCVVRIIRAMLSHHWN
jgi:hypothetical protein